MHRVQCCVKYILKVFKYRILQKYYVKFEIQNTAKYFQNKVHGRYKYAQYLTVRLSTSHPLALAFSWHSRGIFTLGIFFGGGGCLDSFVQGDIPGGVCVLTAGMSTGRECDTDVSAPGLARYISPIYILSLIHISEPTRPY